MGGLHNGAQFFESQDRPGITEDAKLEGDLDVISTMRMEIEHRSLSFFFPFDFITEDAPMHDPRISVRCRDDRPRLEGPCSRTGLRFHVIQIVHTGDRDHHIAYRRNTIE